MVKSGLAPVSHTVNRPELASSYELRQGFNHSRMLPRRVAPPTLICRRVVVLFLNPEYAQALSRVCRGIEIVREKLPARYHQSLLANERNSRRWSECGPVGVLYLASGARSILARLVFMLNFSRCLIYRQFGSCEAVKRTADGSR
jgi:hypothetical protein